MRKIEVSIDEDSLSKAITDELVGHTVGTLKEEIFGESRYSLLRRVYKEQVQNEIRKMLKAHEKEIIDRAVSEASVRIAKKGISQLLEQRLEGLDG